MSFPFGFLIGLWALLSSGATAEAVTLRLETEPMAEASFEVRLHFVPAGRAEQAPNASPPMVDEKMAGQGFSILAKVPGTSKVDLSAAALWTVELEAEDYWTPPRVMAGDPSDPTGVAATLRLVPTRVLSARLMVDDGFELPTQLFLRFRPLPENGAEPARELGGTLPCRLQTVEVDAAAETRARCRAPIGRWDLRFEAPGFAAIYRWGVKIEPWSEEEGSAGEAPATIAASAIDGSPIDGGVLKLKPGATVLGRVALASGEPLQGGVKVRLEPAATLPGRTLSSERAGLRALEVKADVRGHFLFADCEPGVYVLKATKNGLAPAELGPLHLRGSEAEELEDPLLLHPPLRLVVAVGPAVDALGDPWRVSFLSTDDPGIHGAGLVDGEGRWQSEVLDPGRYLVSVRDAEGSFGRQEIHELFPGSPPLELVMETVPVEGEVTLAGEPVSATLWFGGKNGLTSIELESDAQGRFFGILPREGIWELDIRAPGLEIHRRLRRVEVERGSDGIAEVEVRLPDTRIEGRVVDEQGRAVEGARVLASGFGARERPAMVRSDEDGHFAYRGFEPGTYSLQALASDERQSNPQEGQVDEDRPWVGARLVVEAGRLLGGRVFDAESGLPVVGARVSPHIRNAKVGVISTPTQTDPEGRFEMRLPSAITEADLAVLARGYDLALLTPKGGGGVDIAVGLSPASGTALVIPIARQLSVAEMAEAGMGFAVLKDSRGRVLDLTLLRQWSYLQAEPVGDTTRVPNLPPDVYTLCWQDFSPPPAAGSTPPTADRPPERDCETRALGPFSEVVFDRPNGPREPAAEESGAPATSRGDS